MIEDIQDWKFDVNEYNRWQRATGAFDVDAFCDGRRSRSVLTRTGDTDHITCNTNPTAFITASPAMSSKPVAQLSAHSSKLAIAGDL